MLQLKEALNRNVAPCKHAYKTATETWCKLNIDKNCDHPGDPENCEYNMKGIEREEY